MKNKLLFSVFFVFGISVCFSQNNEIINEELLVQFSSIEKTQSKFIVIPEINWPIQSFKNGEYYEYQFQLNNNIGNEVSLISLEDNSKVEIITINNVSYLHLTTIFPPQCQQKLARVFYRLGIDQILLNKKIVSVFQYDNEYKNLSHKELLKNRVYVEKETTNQSTNN